MAVKEAKAKIFGYEKIYNHTIAEMHRTPFRPHNEEEQLLAILFLRIDKQLKKGFTTNELRDLLMRLSSPADDLLYRDESVTLSEFMTVMRNSKIPIETLTSELQLIQQHPRTK